MAVKPKAEICLRDSWNSKGKSAGEFPLSSSSTVFNKHNQLELNDDEVCVAGNRCHNADNLWRLKVNVLSQFSPFTAL